jgi:phosphoglycerol transferase MdoB-like AlkP superfamily enzyme
MSNQIWIFEIFIVGIFFSFLYFILSMFIQDPKKKNKIFFRTVAFLIFLYITYVFYLNLFIVKGNS